MMPSLQDNSESHNPPKPRRVIYMGTPDFAVPALRALIKSENYRPLACVTRADQPRGRGHKLQAPPVKECAVEAGIEVLQPTAIRKGKLRKLLEPYEPELLITCAYGRILPTDVLALPEFGCVNLHASLLPKYRGPSPIQAAILEGDEEAGISFMAMSSGMDEGDILAQYALPLTSTHTAEQLFHELSNLAAEELISFLDRYFAGEITRVPQDHSQATYVKTLTREDGLLDFSDSAEVIDRQVRGLYSWPGAFSFYNGKRFKILEGRPLTADEAMGEPWLERAQSTVPGTIVEHKGRFILQTGEDFYEVLRYQPAGSRVLTAKEAAHNLKLGTVLGEQSRAEK